MEPASRRERVRRLVARLWALRRDPGAGTRAGPTALGVLKLRFGPGSWLAVKIDPSVRGGAAAMSLIFASPGRYAFVPCQAEAPRGHDPAVVVPADAAAEDAADRVLGFAGAVVDAWPDAPPRLEFMNGAPEAGPAVDALRSAWDAAPSFSSAASHIVDHVNDLIQQWPSGNARVESRDGAESPPLLHALTSFAQHWAASIATTAATGKRAPDETNDGPDDAKAQKRQGGGARRASRPPRDLQWLALATDAQIAAEAARAGVRGRTRAAQVRQLVRAQAARSA